MAMPTRIQVGPHTYAVIHEQAAIDRKRVEGRALDQVGQVNTRKHIIHLDPQLSPSETADTLLHEIRHAVSAVVGIDGDDTMTDEANISRTTGVLLDTLRRNPDLVRVLMGDT